MRIDKRRKTLLTVVALLILGVTLSAQTPRPLGIKGGLNVSNLYNETLHDKNARLGVHAGLFGQIISTPVFAMQAELLYSNKGSEAKYTGTLNQQINFNLNYIDLPLLAVLKLGRVAEIHAGGYASYLLGANTVHKGDLSNGTDKMDKDNFTAYDLGAALGVGINFGPVQVGARYNYGLVEIAASNLAKSLLGNAKNSLAQLYVSVNMAR